MTASTTPERLSDAAVRPLRTLDPDAPLDDLQWLDDVIGDARVIAIGESAHYNRESYQLRHRLLRYLVERHGFDAYAFESGFTEGWSVDNWVRGGGNPIGQVMANDITSLMGLWKPMRAQLEWMAGHNRASTRAIGFYGIDLSGSNASLLPGLDAVLGYLAQAEPEFRVDPDIRETAAAFSASSAFSIPAAFASYGKLAPAARDSLTASLADLTAGIPSRRLDYLRRTTEETYERACHSLSLTVTIDAMFRALARGDRHGMMMLRDTAIAGTVEWILRRTDRIVLAAHNAHVQRWPGTLPGMLPVTTMGVRLADRLGSDYRVVGMTTTSGRTLNPSADFFAGQLFTDMEAPEPGSLDALMAASHDGLFATDLRRLSPSDAAIVGSVTRQRYGTYYSDLSPLDAYDAIVHIPHVTAADPDVDALTHAPREVRDVFSRWKLFAEVCALPGPEDTAA
ncbi:erythromycin esterase family protein [Nocardia sp. NEAU-G5]|uniref:Erythromycin esterase family protein n=1 Tax=Nocardia albiluteola TaxID=2842303 RepID=A0ABS6B6D8_9NOCA|nr:erythromycin esterase family protein [Nocardia albiluteola]MBU3065872.1 erythromycin esterase family protein [Nocardia albiluteola]